MTGSNSHLLVAVGKGSEVYNRGKVYTFMETGEKEINVTYMKDDEELKTKFKVEVINKRLVDFEIKEKTYGEKGKVIVKNTRTFSALGLFSKDVKNPCVLNFASATNPGGGVQRGSNAQEECLCRCSTLYSVISNNKFFKFQNIT